MTTSSSMPQAPPPGLTVGGYRLRARLGEGGMGVVHLGQRPGERPVALKVLRPHIVGDDEARRRLAREVSSLERIRSHRIAEIIDADPWGDIPYVATRYVPGLSLHDHVREEGALRGDDLLWFADCLAEALTAVHQVGVLHRDIKPSNVIMEGRSPVLIDFGLARVADDPRLTMTGWLLGTPGYLAPEILHGEDATAASDVHAWAATVAFAVRPLVERALSPDPGERPTLPDLRVWLARLSGRREPAPVPAPAPAGGTTPMLTLPYSAQAEEGRVAATEVGSVPAPGRTRVLPDGTTEVISEEYGGSSAQGAPWA
ncbi:MAG: serine/threonine protein kinase, partial [Nocardioides sp.]|nr:serine/threonine protein kinase [Nocardioides sp.]